MKKFQSVVLLVMFSAVFAAHASASPFDLAHWGFNINGDVFMGGYDWGYDSLSDSFDDSGFDWDTGIGSITLSYDPGAAGKFKQRRIL
ncbi:MAG: hypothetical protein GY795_32795 [Desulfobacterales bacterium]|nr:hypothetical protein [Desulfobacterales bacterium]